MTKREQALEKHIYSQDHENKHSPIDPEIRTDGSQEEPDTMQLSLSDFSS